MINQVLYSLNKITLLCLSAASVLHVFVGVVDYSGFELRYLDEQRKYDAGVLMVGHSVTPAMIVPPGSKEFSVFGVCNESCTASVSVCVACTTTMSVRIHSMDS